MYAYCILESGAIASVNYHRLGQLLGKNLHWTISGTEGEIEFTVNRGLQMGSGQREIRIKTTEDKEPRVVDWQVKTPAHIEGVQFPGQNTAYLYEAYARGDKDVADFKDAVRLHRLLDRIAKDAGYA
ncbi:uncharacterized protein TRIVIDRAFT_70997 [Trichoderma virens Gv29-8]|uniref:Gfo/Idh/MocA-like oxidoreductase C-terminal domain-containing protein n=1 Tax=Hypocrea virens (strain Gv29-8 / FGSC 10586) TaxID=413071 RepID=G9MUA8_HYPVG|nr:uncharacterized protein TRIVIDRAFT_70997 [Trichoderma virens Gv29-8]EHK21977.1 hypothetical protein TRIVIDRAFT_70997 [Trichoderma virens Gv29-8]UKZ55882.1 hypothetical protein TrVGV298_009706 [Trichoderma virens]